MSSNDLFLLRGQWTKGRKGVPTPKWCKITPEEDFSIYTLEALYAKVQGSWNDFDGCCLNLSHVKECDTAAIQFMVSLKKTCLAAERPFKIASSAEAVDKLLELYALKSLFGENI